MSESELAQSCVVVVLITRNGVIISKNDLVGKNRLYYTRIIVCFGVLTDSYCFSVSIMRFLFSRVRRINRGKIVILEKFDHDFGTRLKSFFLISQLIN